MKKLRCNVNLTVSFNLLFLILGITSVHAQKNMEYLDRGLVAVAGQDQVFLSWRMFATDTGKVEFNLYRNDELINPVPISGLSNSIDSSGTTSDIYHLETIRTGEASALSTPVSVWQKPYLTIPLQTPPGYSPNDASIGDLDGDGTFEIVVKMEGSTRDNSQSGITDPVYLHAYTLYGTFLWSIDLGINIRGGAHYTQFMVYDLDSDGRAEVACKTAPGTRDGSGAFLSVGPAADDDDAADYRNGSGYILDGPEYLTVFEGLTGKEMATVNYIPHRSDPYSLSTWGDTYGNRVDRFLACVAYFESTPSLVMCRGYYDRTTLTAWDFRNGELTMRWAFDTQEDLGTLRQFEGQGAHSIAVGDVDLDGKDEIMYGAMAFDDDGTPLYNTTFGHGDATHLSDLVPSNPGQEFFMPHESAGYSHDGVTNPGISLRDAATGEIIMSIASDGDIGRGMTADITADQPGNEFWAASGLGVYNSNGQKFSSSIPSINFAAWWDGDLLRELLDGNVISKWGKGSQLIATGCSSNNGTKSNPALSGDILGDWREEVIWRTNDNQALRIYTTTKPTPYGIYTLLQDPQYRQALAWQNVAYNQPPHPSFFIGHEMADPPVPDIHVLEQSSTPILNILSPRNGDKLNLGPDLDVIIHAAGLSDTNQVVLLYDNEIFLDSLPSAPYTTTLPGGLPTGEHALTASAYNPDGQLFWSNPVSFTVDSGHPHISITSPADKAIFEPGESFTVVIDAYDTDGDLDSVGVWVNDQQVALLTEKPFTYAMNDPDVGSYLIAATAWDDEGNSTDASGITVEVGPIVILQEDELGFCGFNDIGGTIDSNHEGHTGSGFANTDNQLGAGLTWALSLPADGSYSFTWRYAATTARPGDLYINDILVGTVDFQNTSAWTIWESVSLRAEGLTAGIKKVRLLASGSNGLANIDYLKVISLGSDQSAVSAECSSLPVAVDPLKDPFAGSERISIYPVPARHQLHVGCEDLSEHIRRLGLYRMDGSLVRIMDHLDDNRLTLDVAGLESGMYFLQIDTEKGLYVRKFNVIH